jgi:hypothetical protein
MGQDRNDLREKVTGKAGEIKDELRAGGEKAVESSVQGARQVADGARRNKAQVAVATAATAVLTVVLAGWRIVRRRKST